MIRMGFIEKIISLLQNILVKQVPVSATLKVLLKNSFVYTKIEKKSCLMYADDLILFSFSHEDLQMLLDRLKIFVINGNLP